MKKQREDKFDFEESFKNLNLVPICIKDNRFQIKDDSMNLNVFGPTAEECLANARAELLAKYESALILQIQGV